MDSEFTIFSSQLLTVYREDKEDNYKTFILFIKIWILSNQRSECKNRDLHPNNFLPIEGLVQSLAKKALRKCFCHPFMTSPPLRDSEPPLPLIIVKHVILYR